MTKLSHKRAHTLIQRAQLSDQERTRLADHLTQCAECRGYLAMHLHLSQNLQLEPARTWPTPEIRSALRRRVHNQHRRMIIMKPIQALAGIAVLIVLIVAGWMFFSTSEELEPELVSVEVTSAAVAEPTTAPTTTAPTDQETLDELLFDAIIDKDTTAAKQALEADANPNAVNSAGVSALIRAIRSVRVSGNTEIIELLLEFGADVSGQESDGKPALTEAAQGGQLEVVQVLLDAGADVNATMSFRAAQTSSYYKQAPVIMHAVNQNHIEIVELLIDHGADVNQAERTFELTALHDAAAINLAEIIGVLLDNGADPNLHMTWRSETPLHTALRFGSVEAIQALLDGGTDVDIQGGSLTPMMYLFEDSISRGKRSKMTEIVTILLDEGADLTVQDIRGDTALHYASQRGLVEVIPLLIEHGVVLDMENNNGETALDIAANDEIAAMLREAGAAPSAQQEPAKITTLEELVGYWQISFIDDTPGRDVYRFRADGILEVAESLAAYEAGEVKARANYWFEDGMWTSQVTNGIWYESQSCVSGTGKPTTGVYEIHLDDAGDIQFIRIRDRCYPRMIGMNSLTPLDVETEGWLNDPETGLPLNPSELPMDSQFVLVGTMLNLDVSDVDAPLVTLRLPSGQVVELIGPPLPEIAITGEDPPDLTAYDPLYPVRSRLLVQLQDDSSLLATEMRVLTTLE